MSESASPSAVESGMRKLLDRRAAEIAAGAEPVGWKIGFNAPAIQAHFGLDGPVVGYLTDSTVVEVSRSIDLAAWEHPMLEVEVAVRVGDDGHLAGLAPALELVDLNLGFDDLEPILAGNIFHRGVVFGPEVEGVDVGQLTVEVVRSGEQVAEGSLTEMPEDTVDIVRAFLRAHGADLASGDRIIAGSLIAPLAITAGDELHVSFGALGSLSIDFR